MAAETLTPTRWPRALAAGLLAPLLLIACGGQKEDPKTLPPQTVTSVTPELEPPPPLPPPIREVPPTPRDDRVKVIDEGAPQAGPASLIEASRLAKARNRETPPSVVEINDENLHEYAEGGQVIVMESPPAAAPLSTRQPAAADGAAPAVGTAPPTSTASAGGPRDEVYWRSRGLELRRAWRDAFDEIGRLELEAAALRQRFYAEDDPYIRDTQVKPSWDRALDRIAELKADSERYAQALDDFEDEGAAAGIAPGWLREGWELEPTDEELEEAGLGNLEVQTPVGTPLAPPPSDVTTDGGGR